LLPLYIEKLELIFKNNSLGDVINDQSNALNVEKLIHRFGQLWFIT
jgi:hypothetical protein